MKKPWQIWTVFLLCLSGLIGAMFWLSIKTIKLDSARENDRVETELARRQSELQERISSALYRMDLKLLPLVSQEASRPHYLYESFYETANPTLPPAAGRGGEGDGLGGKGGGGYGGGGFAKVPSPLLTGMPEFVLLHFQIKPGQVITSPQKPVGEEWQMAKTLPITNDASQVADRVESARQFCRYESLIQQSELLEIPNVQIAEKGAPASSFPQTVNMYSVPAIEKVISKINAPAKNEMIGQNYSVSKVAQQQMRIDNRANEEFNRRRDSTRIVASQGNNLNQMDNSYGGYQQTDMGFVHQGVMQPIWIGDNLILYRRIEGKGDPFFQCCWLDWDAIQTALQTEVADILPSVDFQPVNDDTELNIGTALTTLPVQLLVDSKALLSTLSMEGDGWIQETSGLKMALLLSWLGLGLAAIASAFLLHGVMKLSERRAAFVSAVTHELRTPLTTFRMYSEMLAEKMVPENKQQQYANTLRLQADRLSHLVENVLQFARLERNPTSTNTEEVAVDDLVERFSSRLKDRATEAEMQLEIRIDESATTSTIQTQPANIEQVLFNLVDNACKYAKPNSKNLIELDCQRDGRSLRFSVRDYGPGVAPKFKKTMFQPFSKSDLDAANSAPGVGLGLALCQRMAKSLGGKLFHESLSDGAKFVLEIPTS